MLKVGEGGLGMPNLRNVIKTKKMMLIKRIICDEEQIWKVLPRKYLKSLDRQYNEEYFLLKAIVPETEIDVLNIPLFYKECIKAWQELLMKRKDPNTKEEILKERLWFNPKIKIKDEMLNNKTWARANINKVSDIITENGEIRRQNIKSKLPNIDSILYLNKAIAATPIRWKQILQCEDKNNNKQELEEINIEWLHNTNSKRLGEKLQMEKVKTRWEKQWEELYGNQQWEEIYKVLNNKVAERKCKDLQWKAFNFGLTTDEKLEKINLSNGKCKMCTIEKETIIHLFYDCELIDPIWSIYNKITKEIWNVDINNDKTVLFANICEEKTNSSKHVIQYIIMSIKWILWKKRNILRYEEIWTNETDTQKWVNNYLKQRTETIMKTKIEKDILIELSKLLHRLK